VSLELKDRDKNYRIVRTIKPSKLQLFIDGKDETLSTMDATEKFILSQLNIDEASFKNCVIMSIGGAIPFMAQKKPDRKKYIEGIFDISVFTEINKEVSKDIRKLNTDIDVLNSNISNIKTDIEKYALESGEFESKIRDKVIELTSELEKTSEAIVNKNYDPSQRDELSQKIEKINGDLKKISDKKDEILETRGKLSSKISVYRNEVSNRNKTISNLISGGTCPTCLRPIDEHAISILDNYKLTLSKEIDSFNENIDKIQQGIVKCNDQIQKINELYTKYNSDKENVNRNINKLNLIDTEIKFLSRERDKYISQIEDVKSQENKFQNLKIESEKKLENHASELERLCLDKKVLDVVNYVYSEKGVKSFITNKVLNILNSKIDYYLSKMNINCRIEFNEFFEEQIITHKKTNRSYDSFSSGERRSIDISIMFAFMDLQKLIGKFEIDTNFYDELIDSSLDEDGVGYVLEILKEKVQSENKKIYLITHRKEASKLAEGEIIMLEKFNGITKRI
jgi:DNA repair exonuclease SbcCD ATPase subunit